MAGDLDERLRALVERMGEARNPETRTYMPTALLAVCDLAEQGLVREGMVEVADYKRAFKRLMLECCPEQEDIWFRPMLHVKKHALWQPMLAGRDVPYDKRRVSSLTERKAAGVADALRLDKDLREGLASPPGRALLRTFVYQLLTRDNDQHSSRLASVHEHLDPAEASEESLAYLEAFEHRREDRDAFEDMRRRQWASRVVREGQAAFRATLLDAYEHRCCISEANALPALEAAHIIPYLGPRSNAVENGLLLRSDLHSLFDHGLIMVVTKSVPLRVDVHPDIQQTVYSELQGLPIRLPQNPRFHPDRAALDYHRRKSSS